MTISTRAQKMIPQAKQVLGKKKFTKARYLSKKMEISAHLAGQILAAMPEWSKYSNRGSRNTWIKGVME